jgi:homocysteine S-methyltransferase
MKITDRCAAQRDETLIICDFSPLKSGRPESFEPALSLDADYISVAYVPGKAVRVSSIALAQAIRHNSNCDAIFNLGTRDMNKLAIQSQLLGAQLMGLANVLVLQGDPFTEKQRAKVKEVADFTPSGLIASIQNMNKGLDYKGLKLQSRTDFCVGATVDLSRGMKAEASLTAKKIRAGADYLLTQPIFNAESAFEFVGQCEAELETGIEAPIFWGLQVFAEGGLIFSSVPDAVRERVEAGEDGIKIAVDIYEQLRSAGINRFYLIPPILKGGHRDYQAAQNAIAAIRNSTS